MITPQDPPKRDPVSRLDELSPGYDFDARMRFEARVEALVAAAKSMTSSASVDSANVISRAEVFESWLLRPPPA